MMVRYWHYDYFEFHILLQLLHQILTLTFNMLTNSNSAQTTEIFGVPHFLLSGVN